MGGRLAKREPGKNRSVLVSEKDGMLQFINGLCLRLWRLEKECILERCV